MRKSAIGRGPTGSVGPVARMLRRGGTRTSGIWRESWQAGEAARSMPYGLFGPPSDPTSGAYHRSVDRRRCDAVVTCGNPPATIPAILQPRCAVHSALAYRLMAGSGHVCCHVGDADHLDCGRVHHRSHARNGCGRFDAQACPTQAVGQRPVLGATGRQLSRAGDPDAVVQHCQAVAQKRTLVHLSEPGNSVRRSKRPRRGKQDGRRRSGVIGSLRLRCSHASGQRRSCRRRGPSCERVRARALIHEPIGSHLLELRCGCRAGD